VTLVAAGVKKWLARIVIPVEVRFQWRPQTTDPNDEMVIEAAINGRADALVTHNVRDFAMLRKRFGIEVLYPAQMLDKVEP
jgi:predicted nucleic acid-binding protein